MRIIGGSHKGRRFSAPKSIPARPTTDYAKEGLFNILNQMVYWPETNALDLFCGIGGLSFELASRGARSITSVDMHYQSVKWINAQAREWEMPITGQKMDALKWIARNDKKFELIVADPPYDYAHHDELLSAVLKTCLSENGILVIEHGRSHNFEVHKNCFDTRNYGEVNFSFFNLVE